MTLIYLVVLLILIIGAVAYYHTTRLDVNHVYHSLQENQPVVICQLSDLHLERNPFSPERIAKVVEDAKPDFLTITGDFIEKEKALPKLRDWLQRFFSVLSVPKEKRLFVLGNHEYYLPQEKVEEVKGILSHFGNVLNNENKVFPLPGENINFLGVDDLGKSNTQLDKAMDNIQPGPVVMLSHDPDVLQQMNREEHPVDLILAGHLHGSQIWLPFNLGFRFEPMGYISNKLKINRGLHKIKHFNLYLSRGIGNTKLPFRFFSTPEVTFHHLGEEPIK
jgi:predicted MPP superfamily phosphohydrolase